MDPTKVAATIVVPSEDPKKLESKEKEIDVEADAALRKAKDDIKAEMDELVSLLLLSLEPTDRSKVRIRTDGLKFDRVKKMLI